ncbi:MULTISPECIES: hypothetical protein [unclassified Curtobacterium]|uniref:hypothetical protein n=2 Tax=Curtobacterium TaxID=2034 RepID=UPI0011B58D0B|nr:MULTISPECIES: hypothetical protein [unclassified Curtobacterium]
MSHSLAHGDWPRMSERKVAVMTLGWLLSLAVIFLMFVICPLALRAYDHSHPKTVTCEGSTAEATSVRVSSTNLSSTSIPQVEVTTKSCGVLNIQRGITDENRGRIAASLKPGDWELVVGARSFNFREVLGLLRVQPEIVSYRMDQ